MEFFRHNKKVGRKKNTGALIVKKYLSINYDEANQYCGGYVFAGFRRTRMKEKKRILFSLENSETEFFWDKKFKK